MIIYLQLSFLLIFLNGGQSKSMLGPSAETWVAVLEPRFNLNSARWRHLNLDLNSKCRILDPRWWHLNLDLNLNCPRWRHLLHHQNQEHHIQDMSHIRLKSQLCPQNFCQDKHTRNFSNDQVRVISIDIKRVSNLNMINFLSQLFLVP